MPALIILWKFKYWVAIAVLSFVCLFQLAYTNHLSGKLKDADVKCAAKIQALEQKQLKALAEKQNEINKVSADYETVKSEQRVKTETITREVQKIVDRPIYINVCFDDDGVSAVNKAADIEHTAKP